MSTTTTKRASRAGLPILLPILAATTLLSACGLDSGSSSLSGVKSVVVQEVCAGVPARKSSVAPLVRRAPADAQREAAQQWGVDLGRWLDGQSALGTSPACKAGKPGKPGQAGQVGRAGQSGQTGSAKR